MPVWQQFSQERPETEIVAVAIDFQGAAKARPYVERAGATFPAAVDSQNRLSALFGFKAVPNGVFVDDAGIIRYAKFGRFDIRQPEYRQLIERFAASAGLEELASRAEQAGGFASEAALNHFERGVERYQEGDVADALAEWRQSVALEPDNWVVRKQIWAIEHPERFYAGDVDFDWQREQIAQGQ